jgi:hypothetical protein
LIGPSGGGYPRGYAQERTGEAAAGQPAGEPAVTRRALPPALHAVNEGLAFLLELVMLAALAWWGADTGGGTGGKVALAVGAPLVAIVVWSLLAAPRARIAAPLVAVVAVKIVLFGLATAGLWAIGRPALALAFAVVALVNTAVATVDRDAMKRSAAPAAPGQG